MKEKFINNSLAFINKYQDCNDLTIIKLKYGLEGIYIHFFKLLVVISISLITNTFLETSLFLLFYIFIRTFSHGIHAKSSIACWISTILVYNILPIITKNIIIPKYICFIVIIISFINFSLFAPADTPKKPLIHKKTRLKCKLLSLLIITIFSLIISLNNNSLINNAIIYSLIIQNILINPLTYKLTNTPFNNYKNYKSGLNN